jgi:hypothetical protein
VIRRWLSDLHTERSIDSFYRGDEPSPSLLVYALGDLLTRARPLVCRVIGHRWVDDSTYGPESARDDVYCGRCGHVACNVIHY